MQEYDLSDQEHSLLKMIDLWEKESLVRIQNTAKTAREDLRQMIGKSKERFSRRYHDMINNVRSSREADAHSDNKLHQWIEQLKQLQSEILTSLSIQSIDQDQSTTTDKTGKDISSSIKQDRFSKVIGNVILTDGGLLAKHTSEDWNYEYVLGERLYSQGRHRIRLKLEQNGIPYNIFFGCISTQAIQTRISIKSSFTVGWFGFNQVYQHGIRNDNPHLHGYHSTEFAADDIIQLIFDCERKQIELYHEETDKNHILRVNILKAPLPWQLLMVLTDRDDCVRILPIEKFHSHTTIQTDLLME